MAISMAKCPIELTQGNVVRFSWPHLSAFKGWITLNQPPVLHVRQYRHGEERLGVFEADFPAKGRVTFGYPSFEALVQWTMWRRAAAKTAIVIDGTNFGSYCLPLKRLTSLLFPPPETLLQSGLVPVAQPDDINRAIVEAFKRQAGLGCWEARKPWYVSGPQRADPDYLARLIVKAFDSLPTDSKLRVLEGQTPSTVRRPSYVVAG